MKFDPAKPWVIGRQTSKGYCYFTGRMHPISPDSWTPDIRKALRLSSDAANNLRAHVSAYTWGDTITKERI